MSAIRSGARLRQWGGLIGALMQVGGAILVLAGLAWMFNGDADGPLLLVAGITNMLWGTLLDRTADAVGWHIEVSGRKGVLMSDQYRESQDSGSD